MRGHVYPNRSEIVRIFLLQNPLVYQVSDVISTYVYRIGLQQAEYSLTAAIGFVQSVIGFVLLLSSNYISQKIAGYGLLHQRAVRRRR